MSESDLFDVQLQKPTSAIAYGISRKLAELYPDRAILEARNEWFDLQQFAAAGHCTVAVTPDVHSQIETRWTGPGTRSCANKSASRVNRWLPTAAVRKQKAWDRRRFRAAQRTSTDGWSAGRSPPRIEWEMIPGGNGGSGPT